MLTARLATRLARLAGGSPAWGAVFSTAVVVPPLGDSISEGSISAGAPSPPEEPGATAQSPTWPGGSGRAIRAGGRADGGGLLRLSWRRRAPLPRRSRAPAVLKQAGEKVLENDTIAQIETDKVRRASLAAALTPHGPHPSEPRRAAAMRGQLP
jgi:hypothetical protein